MPKVLKKDASWRLRCLNDVLTDLLVDNDFNKDGIHVTDVYKVTSAMHLCINMFFSTDVEHLLKERK